MLRRRTSEGEDESLYWQLTSEWTDNVEYNQDDEALDAKRRKMGQGDNSVSAEDSQPEPPAASPYHTESPTEAIGHAGLSQSGSDHPAQKRKLMLERNKYAARKCRQMKKEYVKRLENRVAALENQNQTLMEELSSLRETYGAETQ